MGAISVAMVEPQYHVNVGHVSRLMKNFGLQELYLIGPSFDREEAIRYAMHGSDILEDAKTVTLDDLKQRFDYIVGTTAIRATSRLNVLRDSVSAEQLAEIMNQGRGKSFCIVLGREASGMNNRELAACDLVCSIDTKTRYKTMNIAHALAIMLYEMSIHRPAPRAAAGGKKVDLASKKDTKLLLDYIERLADAGNFDRHKKPLLDATVKKLVAKSLPTTKDVMLLISLLRKGLLAIERNKRSRRTGKKKT
jgi:tRNA/rRNA methyltransferase